VGALLVLLTFLLTRTAWGRHVYAVGGNAEAARRAGINVAWVRISCFMMCSTLAVVGGVLLASRTNSVNPNTGGTLTLLYAVGAAVIGGTSLFGGRGRVLDAILGAAVVTVIGQTPGRAEQPVGADLGLPAAARPAAGLGAVAVDDQVTDLAGIPLRTAQRKAVHEEATADADHAADVGDLEGAWRRSRRSCMPR
jgi:ABC-type branched-subunit amino acid transport system permease subunit